MATSFLAKGSFGHQDPLALKKSPFDFRISLSLAQSYDFGEFPFDSHTLALDISSCKILDRHSILYILSDNLPADAHDEHDIVYKWRDENPIQVRTTGMHDPNFDLVKAVTKRCVGGTFLGKVLVAECPLVEV